MKFLVQIKILRFKMKNINFDGENKPEDLKNLTMRQELVPRL